MGKEYFEFLEEEFQALTTQLQRDLAAAAQSPETTNKAVEKQFTRCEAVYQQMRAEAMHEEDFKE